jgi:UDP:flavonoid glycosyltransferase YjiC (YdhE family)
MRISWAGVGRSLPWRLCRPGPLRWAARRVLADPRFAARSRQIAAWGATHDGADRGAELVEHLAARRRSRVRTLP